MSKFQKGQKVWSAVLWFNKVKCASADVVSCGTKVARLSGTRVSEAFGFRENVPIAELHASEIEALEALAMVADTDCKRAESLLAQAVESRQLVADAIARIVGAKP